MCNKTWRLMLVMAVVCVGGWVYNNLTVTSWSGAKWVNLSVQVVDGTSGRPVSGAEVELIDPTDDERSPVTGRTEADGHVVLRNLFYADGVDFFGCHTEYVHFNPFIIRVAIDGFSEFRAELAEASRVPYEKATHPPLNLRYPVSSRVIIEIWPDGKTGTGT